MIWLRLHALPHKISTTNYQHSENNTNNNKITYRTTLICSYHNLPLIYFSLLYRLFRITASRLSERDLWYTNDMLVTVDTGGTKTLVAGFERDGSIGDMLRFPTPADPHEYTRILRAALTEHFGSKTVEAVVVALPGIVKNGVAVWCNNLGWKNFDAQRSLKGILGNTKILVENDANLAGLAETRILDPMPRSTLYVTISTGIGTGFTTDGHIDPGLRLSEGGHALVEYDGTVREWESFASGRAIYNTYGKFARDITSKRAWNHIAERISRGFLAAIPLTQPEVIIIGGSIGSYFEHFGPQLEALLKEKLPPHIPCPRLLQASHPEEAVIYGCYYYALDTLTDY